MKKYKSNYMLGITVQLISVILLIFPGLAIIWTFLDSNEVKGATYLFLLFWLIVVLIVIVGNLIQLLVRSFMKEKVYIDEDSITFVGKKNVTQSMKLEDISQIDFYQGSKHSSCSVTLLSNCSGESLEIKNPSLSMIFELRKRCKNAKFRFSNYKWDILFFCVFTAFSIFVSFFM